ncbi:MAG: class I tRNA ligase family protein, partial [Bacilli bacterium]
LNGMNKEEAISTMISWLEEHKCGTKKVNYRLRDWIFARQRYWGEPIPVVHFSDHDEVLKSEELPLILPELEDYSPNKNGDSPLEGAKDWVNVMVDGKIGKRETSTMPGSAGSSWYFLRYIDPHNEKELANKELLAHWLPVDLYLGGPEHAVGHLLYSRFWNNYLFDKGIVPVKEPFKKLVHQGMILGTNGEKMSKSRGNVINPDQMVDMYGADALRIYEMFMGPLAASKPWDPKGIEGSKRFVDRVYRIFEEFEIKEEPVNNLEKIYHATVKKVTEDYENLSFNTAISQMMIFVNAVFKEKAISREYAEGFVKLLNPVAPHITEEIFHTFLGHEESITYCSFPTYNETKLVENEKEIAVQVNGKVRSTIFVKENDTEDMIIEQATSAENVLKHIQGMNIVKVIVIKGKIVNIVVK